jgi:hypothetical protein
MEGEVLFSLKFNCFGVSVSTVFRKSFLEVFKSTTRACRSLVVKILVCILPASPVSTSIVKRKYPLVLFNMANNLTVSGWFCLSLDED